jgi:hypothetical protein
MSICFFVAITNHMCSIITKSLFEWPAAGVLLIPYSVGLVSGQVCRRRICALDHAVNGYERPAAVTNAVMGKSRPSIKTP